MSSQNIFSVSVFGLGSAVVWNISGEFHASLLKEISYFGNRMMVLENSCQHAQNLSQMLK